MTHPAKQADHSARPLLATCAMGLALAALLHGGIANAQVHAIQGTGNVVAGLAAIDDVGGTAANPRTNVRLDSSTVVINWTPNDTAAGSTPIDFVSANGLAYFYSQTDPNFTVLNRVLPATTRPVGINGDVQGVIDISGITNPAGNVWFYSPTGIVAGSGSSFSANGVILTANDIAFTGGPSGGINYGPNGEIPFEAAPGSQAQVAMLPGSLISNSGDGGYALLVAPSIVQAGTIQLDGSVGIVAAEKANIIVSNSLFDIDVEVGTSVANAIIHSGTTGTYSGGGMIPGPQNVVLMAVPQSTAITMLLGGNLGADTTAVATDRGVIISGGYDYNDLTGPGLAATPESAVPINVEIGTSSFNARTTALATGSITVNASRGSAIAFMDDASLIAGSTASVVAELDETITVAGNLLVGGPVSQVRLTTTNSETGAGLAGARIDVAGDLTVDASMIGPTAGADGFGGTASIQLDAGASGPLLNVGGSTLVAADGTGQESATSGGSGFGGLAQIIVNGGTLSLGDAIIRADGLGVDAPMGGTAGQGIGGTAQFIAAGAYSIADLVISANGQGGYALASADSGAGRGGVAAFINQGSTAAASNSRTVGNLLLWANGDGDLGGGLTNAVGGFVRLSDLASGTNGRASFADVSLQTQGYSTLPGKGALIESSGGTLAIDNALNVDSAGTVTISVDGNSTIRANGSVGVFSWLGDIVINHTGQGTPQFPTISGADVVMEAGTNILAGPDTLLTAGSGLILRAREGDITAGNLAAVDEIRVHALGDVFLRDATTTGPFVDFSSFLSGGSIEITAGVDPIEMAGPYQPADIIIGGSISASGQLFVHAGRDILGVSTPSSLQGESVQLIAERDISAPNMSIVSRRGLDTFVSRDLIVGGIDAMGELNMIDPFGQPVLAGQLDIPGTLSIGDLTLRGATPGLLRAAGDLTVGNARATGLDVSSANGTVTVGGLTSLSGGPAGFLTASGRSIALNGIHVVGDIAAVAAQSAAIANASAGSSLTVEAPGTVTFQGLISGTTIHVASGDIVIDPGARIGSAGTTSLIELSNNSSTTSYIGESDNPSGYSLNQAEASQLFANDIAINGSDFVIGAMNVSGGQLGARGTFSIRATGNVQIGGAVNFTGMSSDSTFAIRGGDLILLDNQTGSVNMTGLGSAPGGRLDFSAARIMAVSSATRTALSSLTEATAIDALLGINDGVVNDAGVLRAGSMLFTVSQGLYIQNTGAGGNYPQRRGFTAGAGGIAVNYSSSLNAPLVVINGQVLGLDDAPVSSLATIPLVTINGRPAPVSNGSAAGSTINGCDFTNVTECVRILTTIAATTPTRDLLEDPFDAPSDAPIDRQALISTTVEMENFGLSSYEPLIDEPVTGSGNDDLWEPTCNATGRGACPSAPDTGSEPR